MADWAAWGVVVAACFASAFDLRWRRVPNWFNGVLGVLAVPLFWLQWSWLGFAWAALGAVLALVYWWFGYWGGGDAKFVLVAGFFAPGPLVLLMVSAAAIMALGWPSRRGVPFLFWLAVAGLSALPGLSFGAGFASFDV